MALTKVLVIEDEELVRANLIELLEAEGFQVVSATTGSQGIRLAQTELPHIILCDVLLPELDGYQVLTVLRQYPTTAVIPFIFLTARSEHVDFRQGMSLGADDYLTKPYEPTELLNVIALRLQKQATLIQHYTHQLHQLKTQVSLASIGHTLQMGLPQALEQQCFQIYYQPQVSLRTGQIIGAEALLRWQHPEHGWISPADFIPIAEATGWIIPIGEWVLRNACLQLKQWQEQFQVPLQMAVNLSFLQFSQINLGATIHQILIENQLNPMDLELELTETLVMQDVHATVKILAELQALNVKVAIDDFGIGYSSLSYLQHLPLNTLKIDRCFIQNIPTDAKNAAITQALLQMAQSLNLQVVAEGVETLSELEFLYQYRCDAIQGYLFSRPVPANEFAELLRLGKGLSCSANPVPRPVMH